MLPLLIPAGVAVGGLIAKGIASGIKSKAEKSLEGDIASEKARLAAEEQRLSGGGGGMSASKLAAAQSQARGAASSAANEQIANAVRGSAAGGGASGMAQNAIGQAQMAEQAALAQNLSNIRAADLDYAQAQRDALVGQRAALFNQQMALKGMADQRKAAMLEAFGQAAGVPLQMGMSKDYMGLVQSAMANKMAQQNATMGAALPQYGG